MRKVLALVGLLGVVGLLSVGSSQGNLISIVFQSKWFPQSQFAGYWVAGGHLPGQAPSDTAQTFYADEGLDVTILDGGNVNPSVNVAVGNADFGTDWIANMLVQKAAGLDLVHIAQMFQRPGYELVALKTSGIESIQDFRGRNVGVWAFGNEFASEACFRGNGLTSDLDPNVQNPDVRTTVYAFDPALVFPNAVDVASAMVYNELDQIVGLGFPLDTLNRFPSADNNCGLLEDFIFTTRALLESPSWKNTGLSGRELAIRFVRASIRGWQYAITHQPEAVETVLDFCGDTCNGSGSTQSPLIHQAWQMARIAELVQPALLGLAEARIGYLEPASYSATVSLLEQIGLIPPGTGEGVVTYEIWEAATAQ
ncbi:MAG: ABC transporter substrate-binding protein [Deinococcus sp.]|nr:ABC transporter substrate-binding protein [Deinococcus sp.]